VPSPSVYNADVFGAGYTVFTAGAYDIDFGVVDTDPATVGTTVTLDTISGTSGLDLSSYDDAFQGFVYDDPTDNAYNTFEFDGDYSTFDPIVLDLNGDGTDILPRNDSTVYFNLDADAYLERTASRSRARSARRRAARTASSSSTAPPPAAPAPATATASSPADLLRTKGHPGGGVRQRGTATDRNPTSAGHARNPRILTGSILAAEASNMAVPAVFVAEDRFYDLIVNVTSPKPLRSLTEHSHWLSRLS
jgi:hypothetical protein